VAWLVLTISGVLEAVWAVALGKSEGLSRPVPTAVFLAAVLLSMGGLAYALRSLPVGTTYATWVGIGASLAVTYDMVFEGAILTAPKIFFTAVIIAGIVGLKLVE
jgi:quaternary ammonium compound-resistance protein SugE